MRIIGNVDRCDGEAIEGWLHCPEHPDEPLRLDIFAGGTHLGQCVADIARTDLALAGVGDGKCAFTFRMPAALPAAALSSVQIRLAGSVLVLPGPPRAPLPAAPALLDPPANDLAGLWIDRADWSDLLARKHRRGELSDAMADAIFRFVRDGFIVISGAVPDEVVDALNRAIDDFWRSPPTGLLMETFEPEGQMRVVPLDVTYRAGRTKMLDLYAVSSAARLAILSSKAIPFLTAIFEDVPKTFQGLTFWNGSQQAMRKDTAYVRVAGNKLALAASWLALEDVQPGSGALEYYAGSHRSPHFLFGGTDKWIGTHHDEHERFLQSLHADAEREGYPRGAFAGHKGDVLIWHADLAHGGAKVTRAGLSRRSLVTHYCPAAAEPFYRGRAQHKVLDLGTVVFVAERRDVG